MTAPLDIAACRRTLVRRAEARRAASRRRWEQAQADATRLIAHLARHYRPDRIWVWPNCVPP